MHPHKSNHSDSAPQAPSLKPQANTPHQDTIVAVSSPPGRSARGLIRLSGGDAKTLIASLADVPLQDRTLTACGLQIPSSSASSSGTSLTLPALLTYFAGPRSYTGQDLIEIQVPGNPALLDRLLHTLIAAGARQAEPGEFTFRAYLAGKLDLTQAEGIAATIAAVSDSQLQAAAILRDGALGRFSVELVDTIGTLLALVEAGIDFTDQDDVVPILPGVLDAKLALVENKLDDLLSHSRSWGAIEAMPRVVLVGEPSAGKSTLFNALLGHERAVISEQPGTTRDLLAEPLLLRTAKGEAMEVMLVDIAGLDEARSAMDEQMQIAARRAIDTADLLLLIHDESKSGNASAAGFAVPPRIPMLHVRTKCDIAVDSQLEAGAIHVSAHTGSNLDVLRDRIAITLGDRAVSVAADMLALQPRHDAALRSARTDLAQARFLLKDQRDRPAIAQVELIAGAMRSALDQLAGLGGTLTPDDVIGRVFATFCIGK